MNLDIDHIAVYVSAVCRSTFKAKLYGDGYSRSNKLRDHGTFHRQLGCTRLCMPLPRYRPQISTSPKSKTLSSDLVKQLLRFDP